jgi:hypothetical protein
MEVARVLIVEIKKRNCIALAVEVVDDRRLPQRGPLERRRSCPSNNRVSNTCEERG